MCTLSIINITQALISVLFPYKIYFCIALNVHLVLVLQSKIVLGLGLVHGGVRDAVSRQHIPISPHKIDHLSIKLEVFVDDIFVLNRLCLRCIVIFISVVGFITGFHESGVRYRDSRIKQFCSCTAPRRPTVVAFATSHEMGNRWREIWLATFCTCSWSVLLLVRF